MHQVLLPEKLQVISLYKFFMPEAVYCKCGFDIRVVLCTSVPSLIVRNANTTKFYCLRLFVVVYKLVIVVLP